MSQRQNLTRNISYERYFMIIIQRIYFMAGKDEQAKSLAQQVDSISSSRISIPDTKEKNKEQVDKFGL